MLRVSNCCAHRVLVLHPASRECEVVAQVEPFALCIDFLTDGRLLIVDPAGALVLRREHDGWLATHPTPGPVSAQLWNDVGGDEQGGVHGNNTGFTFTGCEVAPGLVALVEQDGEVRQVADGWRWPTAWPVAVRRPGRGDLHRTEAGRRRRASGDRGGRTRAGRRPALRGER